MSKRYQKQNEHNKPKIRKSFVLECQDCGYFVVQQKHQVQSDVGRLLDSNLCVVIYNLNLHCQLPPLV